MMVDVDNFQAGSIFCQSFLCFQEEGIVGDTLALSMREAAAMAGISRTSTTDPGPDAGAPDARPAA